MDKEDYVSLEVAKMLKEKGFEGPCRSSIFKNGELRIYDLDQSWVDMISIDEEYYEFLCPTLYEAHKWLRGKGINVCVANAITVKKPVKWFYTIDLIDNCDGVFPMEYYPSYEEALNNGIGRALKLI